MYNRPVLPSKEFIEYNRHQNTRQKATLINSTKQFENTLYVRKRQGALSSQLSTDPPLLIIVARRTPHTLPVKGSPDLTSKLYFET